MNRQLTPFIFFVCRIIGILLIAIQSATSFGNELIEADHPNLLKEFRLLHDPDHQLTAQQAFEAFQTEQRRHRPHLQGKAYWYLAAINNNSTRIDWSVAYPVPIARRVESYWVSSAGEIQKLKDASLDDFPMQMIFEMPVNIATGESGHLLLRITNDLFSKPPVYMTTAETIDSWQLFAALVAPICLGIMFANLAFGLTTSFGMRDLIPVLYSGYVISHILLIVAANGMLSAWVDDTSVPLRFAGCLMITLCSSFTWLFLQRGAALGAVLHTLFAIVFIVNALYLVALFIPSINAPGILPYRFVSVLSLFAVFILSIIASFRYKIGWWIAGAWGWMSFSHLLVFLAAIGVLDMPMRGTMLTIGSAAEVVLITLAIGFSVDQLRRSKIEADVAYGIAVEDVRRKSEFVDTISHEIRTPLHALLGSLANLRDKKLTEPAQQTVTELQASGEALYELTESLLGFRQAHAAESQQRRVFVPERLFQSVINLYSARAASKGFHIVSNFESLPEQLRGPAPALRRILINLISNAVKYTNAGQIEITAGVEGPSYRQRLTCEIQDSGPGLDHNTLNQLNSDIALQPHDLESLYSSSPSTGLGINITRTLISIIGGDLAFMLGANGGLCVRFNIPVDQVTNQEQMPAIAPFGPIIVVDDIPANLKVTANYLSQIGSETLTASTLNDAKTLLLQTTHPQLLISDYRLGDGTGLELLQWLRAHEQQQLASLPVLIMTAHTTSELNQAVQSLNGRVAAKPFTADELSAAVVEVLGLEGRSKHIALQQSENGSPLRALVDRLGDAEARSVFELFLEQSEQDRSTLNITPPDTHEYRNAAHRLASAAGMLNLLELHQQAIALENSSIQNVPTNQTKLERLLDHAQADIHAFMATLNA